MGLKFTVFEIEIQDKFRFRQINGPYGIEYAHFMFARFRFRPWSGQPD